MDLIKVEDGKIELEENTKRNLIEFKKQLDFYKEKEEEIKKLILEEMEQKNILSYKSDDLTISYTAPTERETFDSKKFREEHSDLYDEYVKFSPVKASVKIMVK